MSDDARAAARDADAGVSYYSALYLAGLLGILFVCFYWGLGAWSLLPFLIGVAGLVTRWGGGPPALLASVAAVLNMPVPWPASRDGGGLPLAELLLCMAVLTCVAAHYRLAGLTVYLIPPDPRARPGFFGRLLIFLYLRPTTAQPQRRAGTLVSQREIARLAVSLPLWAGLAQLAWIVLPVEEAASPLYSVTNAWWRVMLLTWIIGLGLWVTAALLGYWKTRQLTPAATTLFLQDLAWRQTHREQRAVNRWLVWRGLRRQRRED